MPSPKISPTQYLLLQAIAAGERCTRYRGIGGFRWSTPKGTTASTVNAAIRKGLVEEISDGETWRPTYTCTLTDAGRAALADAPEQAEPETVTLYAYHDGAVHETETIEKPTFFEIIDGANRRAFGFGNRIPRLDAKRTPRAALEHACAEADRSEDKAREAMERAQTERDMIRELLENLHD